MEASRPTSALSNVPLREQKANAGDKKMTREQGRLQRPKRRSRSNRRGSEADTMYSCALPLLARSGMLMVGWGMLAGMHARSSCSLLAAWLAKGWVTGALESAPIMHARGIRAMTGMLIRGLGISVSSKLCCCTPCHLGL